MPRDIENWKELVDFLEAIDKDSLAVLDCYATWCGPCKNMAPFYDSLSEKCEDVYFLKADIEKVEELSSEFEVSSMPTFIFLKDLTVVDKFEGADQRKLVSFIEKYR